MREGCMDKVKRLLLKVVRMKTPVAHIAGVEVGFEGFRLDGIILKAKISVKNPYGRLLPISVISYTVKSADRIILKGKMKEVESVPGKKTKVLEVPIKVAYTIISSLVDDITGDGDIDYELDLGLTINLPLFGDLTFPLSWKGEIKPPTVFP